VRTPRTGRPGDDRRDTPEYRRAVRRQVIAGIVIGAIVGVFLWVFTQEWLYLLPSLGIGAVSGVVIRPSGVDDRDSRRR
jgi:cobalamin synthase